MFSPLSAHRAALPKVLSGYGARVGCALALCCVALAGCQGMPEADSKERAAVQRKEAGSVTLTWYGVSTLLFDDGATKILIDGFFSRPQFADLDTLAAPDVIQIEKMIERAQLRDLAAIIPVHSHFDHAMDLGEIARLTGAVVLGSESTANIARGAGVQPERIMVIGRRFRSRFGDFSVELIPSAHAPLVNGGPPMPGVISEPLVPPARISDWKEGGSYSIVVAHPSGTALVQGSAGFVPGQLHAVSADVVLLGIGGLGRLGRDYAERYFKEMLASTSARCVLPIHWDDMMQPFGTIVRSGDGTEQRWLNDFVARHATAAAETPMRNVELRFGRPANLFEGVCPAE